MKLNFVFTIICIAFVLTGNAQSFPPMDVSPMDVAVARRTKDGPPVARVIYSRPQKKDRVIFGNLVPYGQVWRTGANEATELDLYEAVYFGDICIDAGTYTLYTIPEKAYWTIIINSETDTWGAFSYKKEKDLVRMKVPAHRAAAPIEIFSMIFENTENGVNLLIGWDTVFVEIPFRYAQ
ncbi:MAG: DUF2911 domain-containing protein [Bacteroidetes bacterium]|jgi:hypothetical protein|nr:DUF2911 domain-containing protein [Bacteroidota bacterium]